MLVGEPGIGIIFLLMTSIIESIPGTILSSLEIGSTSESILGIVFGSLLFPIYAIGATLVYFDMRVRRECYIVEQMATEATR